VNSPVTILLEMMLWSRVLSNAVAHVERTSQVRSINYPASTTIISTISSPVNSTAPPIIPMATASSRPQFGSYDPPPSIPLPPSYQQRVTAMAAAASSALSSPTLVRQQYLLQKRSRYPENNFALPASNLTTATSSTSIAVAIGPTTPVEQSARLHLHTSKPLFR